MPGPASDPSTESAALESELDGLHRASLERSAELREIVAQLPAVVGRRAMIRTLLGDVRANPNKAEIARRGATKAARDLRSAARDLLRRLRTRR